MGERAELPVEEIDIASVLHALAVAGVDRAKITGRLPSYRRGHCPGQDPEGRSERAL